MVSGDDVTPFESSVHSDLLLRDIVAENWAMAVLFEQSIQRCRLQWFAWHHNVNINHSISLNKPTKLLFYYVRLSDMMHSRERF